MAQTESIEQSFVTINETLDRMEARIDNMNKMLSEILAEIEKHQQPKVFETHSGGIIFRHKRDNLNK